MVLIRNPQASPCQLFPIGQRAAKKVTVKLQRADGSATQQAQKHNFEPAHSAELSNLARSSGLQCGSSFSGQSFDFIENENTETSHLVRHVVYMLRLDMNHWQYYQHEYIPKVRVWLAGSIPLPRN